MSVMSVDKREREGDLISEVYNANQEREREREERVDRETRKKNQRNKEAKIHLLKINEYGRYC